MVDVSCAVIKRHDGKILVTQRSDSMRLPLKWEFPGGKVEPGETEEACLIRELQEELGIKVTILKKMPSFIYDHGQQAIRLIPFECMISDGTIVLAEHAAYLWLRADELAGMDWAPADVPVLNYYLENYSLK